MFKDVDVRMQSAVVCGPKTWKPVGILFSIINYIVKVLMGP